MEHVPTGTFVDFMPLRFEAAILLIFLASLERVSPTILLTRRWIAEHLAMGYESRVSQAVGWVESKRAGPILKMKLRLGGGGTDSTMNGPSL